jgi:nitroimidazol reductase NimA-like FMN-containing flavoprotein (pyridoxamine 5'-phosphate oxidase superfamily)
MVDRDDVDGWSPQGPVTELASDNSWELLRSTSFGRLGVSVDDKPKIFPVDYAIDNETIVFRTAAGTKLHDLMLNRSVVFEVDDRHPTDAWSVVVTGEASVIAHPDEITRADRLPLPHWVPIQTFVYVRVTPTDIHGRRFLRHIQVGRHADAD